jgi:hypothetical protein
MSKGSAIFPSYAVGCKLSLLYGEGIPLLSDLQCWNVMVIISLGLSSPLCGPVTLHTRPMSSYGGSNSVYVCQ